MLKLSKRFLFFSLIVFSMITIIHMIVLYWFPLQLPFSSYLATSLTMAAYFLKVNYLVPIVFMLCVLILFSAFSILKEKIALAIICSIYFFIDFLFLSYSFLDAWICNSHFLAMQAIQILIYIPVIVFLCIYYSALYKARSNKG